MFVHGVLRKRYRLQRFFWDKLDESVPDFFHFIRYVTTTGILWVVAWGTSITWGKVDSSFTLENLLQSFTFVLKTSVSKLCVCMFIERTINCYGTNSNRLIFVKMIFFKTIHQKCYLLLRKISFENIAWGPHYVIVVNWLEVL